MSMTLRKSSSSSHQCEFLFEALGSSICPTSCCRTLTFREGGTNFRFPCVRGLVGLTRLQLSIFDHNVQPGMLTGLCKLKELSISNRAASLPPLVISSAAEVTRLMVGACLVSHSYNYYLLGLRPLAISFIEMACTLDLVCVLA